MQRLTVIRRGELTPQRLSEPTPEQWAIFWKLGDVNFDGVIDQRDGDLINYAVPSTPESANWIGSCDLNGDGIVDVLDRAIVQRNFGLNIWDYFGLSKPLQIPLEYLFGGLLIGAVLVVVAGEV